MFLPGFSLWATIFTISGLKCLFNFQNKVSQFNEDKAGTFKMCGKSKEQKPKTLCTGEN